MNPPVTPKIFHIVHVDRLVSIINDGFLWSDAEIQKRSPPGTTIGMANIKQRRLTNKLTSHPDLCVGDCVPFYFCSRSVMLYLIHKRNPELTYQGGQESIVHLEADLNRAVDWGESNKRRWAFTSSNAGSYWFEDYNDLSKLSKIDWPAVYANDWAECKDGKQAEFLLEQCFPWHLVERIGVYNLEVFRQVKGSLPCSTSNPCVEIQTGWYY